MSASWAWRAFIAFGIVAAASRLLLPEGIFVLWALVGLASTAAVLTGIRLRRPASRLPWCLIAVSQLTFTFGDILQQTVPTLTDLADLLFLVSYASLMVALARFVRSRTAGRDVPALLDALAITTGLGLLSWVFLISPLLRNPALTLDDKLGAVAFPLLDIALLAVLLRLWSGGGQRRTPYHLLGLGVVGLLASDIAYTALALQEAYAPGGAADLGWLAFLVACGAAALHPAMATISAPTTPSDLKPSRTRLSVLAGASLIAPAVLSLQSLLGRPIDAPVISGACVVLFLVTLSRMAWLAAEVTRQNERKQLLGRVLQATEEERTRIATDLHDGPVQSLAVLSYTAHRARKMLARQNTGAADDLLERVEAQLEDEVRVLRRLMADLRPPVLDNRGLNAALSEHVEAFGRETSIDAEVDVRLQERLAPELETVLYRVVQESLNNVAKHAEAQRVFVAVTANNGTIHLRVTDDGRGFDTSQAAELLREGHYGLAGMRERVGLAGGQLEVRSAPGRGTIIEASLPARTSSA